MWQAQDRHKPFYFEIAMFMPTEYNKFQQSSLRGVMIWGSAGNSKKEKVYEENMDSVDAYHNMRRLFT